MQIRTFSENDRTGLRVLFARAGQGSPTESLWGHTDSEAAVYLDPYMDLEPASLFVAEHDGALVGYLTGCIDTEAFPSEDTLITDASVGTGRFAAGRPSHSSAAACSTRPQQQSAGHRRQARSTIHGGLRTCTSTSRRRRGAPEPPPD